MNFDLLPYDGSPEHQAFILGSIRARAGKWPYESLTYEDLRKTLHRRLRWLGTVTRLVASPTDPTQLLGVVMVEKSPGLPPIVVWAYTLPIVRGQGIATWALAQLGLDLLTPTGVLIWSAAASRVAAKGHYQIYPLNQPKEPHARQDRSEPPAADPRS